MTRKQEKLTYLILALIVSTPAWIWLFMHDWRLALAVGGVLWGANLTKRAEEV